MADTGYPIALGILSWAGLALGIVGMAGVTLTLILVARSAARRRGEPWRGYGDSAWSGDGSYGGASPAAGGDGGDCSYGGSDGGAGCGDSGGGDGGGGD
jgi:hypothetical protein